jgi:hypothetical protein
MGTLSFITSATSTAQSISCPSNVQAGDLIIISDVAVTIPAAPSSVVPSGFTLITPSLASGYRRQNLSYKIASGSEGGSNIIGMDGTIDSKLLIILRGSSSIESINVSTVNSEITSNNPVSQDVSSSEGTSPLVVIATYFSYDIIDPRTFSPSSDGEVNIDTYYYLNYKIYNSSPSDVTIDMDDEGDGMILQSFYIEAQLVQNNGIQFRANMWG